jgi:hypothetical protein
MGVRAPQYAATLPGDLPDGELEALRAAAHHLTDPAQRIAVMTLLPPLLPDSVRKKAA